MVKAVGSVQADPQMGRDRGETFAQIVARTLAEPPRPEPEDPSTPRLPDGRRLTEVRSALTPGEARDLVAGGALLAFEGCGCGGGPGCEPRWYDADERRRATTVLPRIRAKTHPGWIDLWSPVDDAATHVVHVHGEVLWGDLMW